VPAPPVILTVEADPGAPAVRLDAFLAAQLPALSRRLLRRVLAAGEVRVNGVVAAKGRHVRAGDRVTLPALPARLLPEPDVVLPIVHEDPTVVIADKPGGMRSHALDPRERGTAAAALVARYPELAGVGEPLAPGLVHRLDTGTSGLLVAARTPDAHRALRAAFHAHAVEKRYLAVVQGTITAWRTRRIDAPLAHDPSQRGRMVAARAGARAWPAASEVVVLAPGAGRTLVEVTIRTGVTHQVRAHLALLGHPVVNDVRYGGSGVPDLPPARHALHASVLVLPHPGGGPPVRVSSDLPADLRRLAPGS
jgi:23S rRNA pseudouridine1911/1915/1917 synthase